MSAADRDPEKGNVQFDIDSVSSSPGIHTPGRNHVGTSHHFRARGGERLRHFIHPNGRRIHVAASPEEAIHLRERLRQQSLTTTPSPVSSSDNDNIAPDDTTTVSSTQPTIPTSLSEDYDVLITGSAEHVSALREAHTHHTSRRLALREKHGPVFDEFEAVRDELDHLAAEMDRVTHRGVELEAHFGRFGYSAHVRSYDEDGSSPGRGSGSASPTARASMESRRGGSLGTLGSAVERGFATPLKLFKTPVVRQYFHQGILWRASQSEEVQSFELFVDLLYVGIIGINGEAAAEHVSGEGLVRFVVTFAMSWKVWNDMAMIISWFETDDVFQRLNVLFLLACLLGFTTCITDAFEHTYATLVGYYLAARLSMACYLAMTAWLVPMVRATMVWLVVTTVVGAGTYSTVRTVASHSPLTPPTAIWIASIQYHYPDNLAPIWVALAWDLCSPMMYPITLMLTSLLSTRARDWFDKLFEFYPALNIEHRVERINAFTTLVFGHIILSILYQTSVNGIDAFYAKAVLSLTAAFALNWLYFEVDGSDLVIHAIRRSKWSSLVWGHAHLVFVMGIALGGGALSVLVVAVDTVGADFHDLEHVYAQRAELHGEHVEQGLRWYLCGGFGLALMGMGLIATTHIHKEPGGQRLAKKWRLVFRLLVAVAVICLPLAGDGLDSLELVATVTGLIVLVLGVELWAVSCCHEGVWGRTRPCEYIGTCRKKELERLVKEGGEVKIEELGEKEESGRARRKSGIMVHP